MDNRWKAVISYLISAIISCTVITMIVATCTSCIQEDVYKEKAQNGTWVPNENYEGWDYCGFNINNVIDTKMSEDTNGNKVHWIIYTDLDADFENAIISMNEETFTLLLEALDTLQGVEPYSKEWGEICDEYEFVILYKGNTNILIAIDKD